jgi:hypothetical protein
MPHTAIAANDAALMALNSAKRLRHSQHVTFNLPGQQSSGRRTATDLQNGCPWHSTIMVAAPQRAPPPETPLSDPAVLGVAPLVLAVLPPRTKGSTPSSPFSDCAPRQPPESNCMQVAEAEEGRQRNIVCINGQKILRWRPFCCNAAILWVEFAIA